MEEDQAEKMEALKKAYAEIILNTAKEAAARAMASERKALRFHHDLINTKDEGLRMLLRFKQMIDAKTTEAEMTSLGQQKRIVELDAQLNEAEGVIVELRAELRKAYERLEEMRNSHMLQSDGPSENEHMHQENTSTHDKKLDVSEQFSCSSQCSRRCNPAKETTTSDNFLIGNPNLASIIIGNNEPEFYRNGYTHRIRAIERNLVDEDINVREICTKKELIVNVDEKDSGKCAPSSTVSENADAKNINGPINSTVAKDQTVKAQRFPRNTIRYARSNHKISRFCHGLSVKSTTEPEKLNFNENSFKTDEKMTENNKQSTCTLRRSIRKRKVRCWDDISSLFKSRAALSRCYKYSGKHGVKFDEHQYISKSTDASEETKLLNESVVEKNEAAAKESTEFSSRNSITHKNRILKYTFSRKSKKVLSSKSDNCSSLDKSFLTHEMIEKPRFFPKHEKPDLIDHPSADGQNMVEVACQLISLSKERS